MTCYVVRYDIARDVAGPLNITYKIRCCDWIQAFNQVCYFWDAWFYVTYCLKVWYLPFIYSWDGGL